MKRCPTCNRTFTDPNLSFCIDDGTPLITSAADDETTVVSPSQKDQAGEQGYKPRDWQTPYQPPGHRTYPDTKGKSKTWPWVAGVFAVVIIVFAGLGIAAAFFIPRLLRTTTNSNSNANAPVAASRTPNPDSYEPIRTPTPDHSNKNDNANSDDDSMPPADENKVLADLTEIEHDWTAANLNADKTKLDRILADDYVGVLQNGRNQGKAEYLATLRREDSVLKWDFEDLKVTLNGDRALLTGVIRYEFAEGVAAFRFVDKFVWRDGRWQAVSSQIQQIQ